MSKIKFLKIKMCELKNIYNLSEEQSEEALQKQIKYKFYVKFFKNWKKCNRMRSRFIDNNQTWMKSLFCANINKINKVETRGRPVKSFENSSKRTQQKRCQQIRNNFSQVYTLFRKT